jgi:hypothetical protein
MMIRCPVCNTLHDGKYQMCKLCHQEVESEAGSNSDPDPDHHLNCPQAWHPKALCRCTEIIVSRYA